MTFKPWIPPAGEVVAPPVHPETVVDTIYSDGETYRNHSAGRVNWSGEGDGPCIVAYEVVEEYHEPVKAREWWALDVHGMIVRVSDTRKAAEKAISNYSTSKVIHIREVLPPVNPAPREVVAWAVLDDDGGDTTLCDSESNAAYVHRKYGGTVVKLVGQLP